MTNTFTEAPESYAAARPLYPPELFEWIASQCAERDVAWDCATGNGQAAVALSKLFRTVHASDVSPEQLSAGLGARNIVYSAQPAEATNFESGTFDLVTVAQALHWFDFRRFWPEVRRVAKQGAFFCAWGYAWFAYPEEVEAALIQPAKRLLEPYWAAENRILWNGYQGHAIAFPFERIGAPDFRLEVEHDVASLVAYIRTWSAFKRGCRDQDLARALEALLAGAEERLGSAHSFRASTPLAVVAGRV
jgi:SAM-dependent methyltransferase